MQIIALFGPTGVGKTERRGRAGRAAARAGEGSPGAGPVAVSADALQVYAGWRHSPAWPRRPSRRRLEHRLVSFLPLDATFSAGQYAQLAHAEIDGLLAAGRRPLVVGGTGPVPACGADRARVSPAAAGGRRASVGPRRSRREGAPALHATLSRARGLGRGRDRPERPPADRARAGAAGAGRARAAGGAVAAVERGAAPSDLARGVDDGARGAVRGGSTPASMRCSRRGSPRRSGGPMRPGASETARKALGFEELLAGTWSDEAAHAQLRKASADVDAQARGRARDRRHLRDPASRRGADPPRLRRREPTSKDQARSVAG